MRRPVAVTPLWLSLLPEPPPGKRRIVLVTGGRDFADAGLVNLALTAIAPGMVIEGGATGADRLCREWATAHGVQVLTMEANWAHYGPAAGPRRNSAMVRVAQLCGAVVVAFPGGSGTADCVGKARAAGLVVVEVEGEGLRVP